MQAQHTADGPRTPTPASGGSIVRFLRPTGRFLAHLAEMCVAMCVGAIVLSLIFFEGAALIGYANLPQQYPELATAVIALNLSLPMAAWMRFRGHEWRPTVEMSGATIVVGILLIVAFWVGIVPKGRLLETQISLACPVMIAVMLFRFNLYSGRAGHHVHAA
jgi:hypothetical protein